MLLGSQMTYLGNLTSLTRKGVIDKAGTAETFGLLDKLTIGYSGNQRSWVNPSTEALPFEGMTGVGLNGVGIPCTYDASGRLNCDDLRGIESIEYDNDGHPVRIVFTSGNEQRDVWDGLGNHLATEYYTPQSMGGKEPYITKSYGGDGQVEYRLGPDIGSSINKVLRYTRFAGGYFDQNSTPHYYVTDYQGNITGSVNSVPEIEEETNYYPYGEPWREIKDNPFTFSGNERLPNDGLNEYDFNARRYYAALPTFLSWDVLNEQYPWLSPYAYCAGNPIRMIDPSGNRPTDYEAALMAQAAYKDKKYDDTIKILAAKDWVISDYTTAIKYNHPAGSGIGIQSILFQKTDKNGVTEYAYTFAGTNSIEDAVEDITQVFGLSPEYNKAIENAKKLSDELENKELTFIGHSMGGGNAIAASMATKRNAITFNTAIVSPFTRIINGLSDSGEIVNYISSSNPICGYSLCLDPISIIQNKCGMKPPGLIVPVYTGYLPTHEIKDIVKSLQP